MKIVDKMKIVDTGRFTQSEREALASFLFYVKRYMCSNCVAIRYKDDPSINSAKMCMECKMRKSYQKLSVAFEIEAEKDFPISWDTEGEENVASESKP